MATPNPLQGTHSTPPPSISSKTFHIAGILTTVYGLDELPPATKSISVQWLLHPRLQTKEIMASVASSCINDWNQRRSPDCKVGLIAVAFDQRNHGSREVNSRANEAWREGNESMDWISWSNLPLPLLPTYLSTYLYTNAETFTAHAQDMFSIFHGTALDTSLLIDHLGSYIFHGPDSPSIDQHLVLGISLGGHAAWQVFFNEPRVTAAIIIIGCPDYMRKSSCVWGLWNFHLCLQDVNTFLRILLQCHSEQTSADMNRCDD